MHSSTLRKTPSLPFTTTRIFAIAALASSASLLHAAITETVLSSTDWHISNGALTVDFNPTASDITKIVVAGHSDNILDPSNSKLYPEFAGTPFGAGAMSATVVQTANYIDFSTTTLSNGTTNPMTYSFHYILFNNDPAIHMYEYVQHSATDPAASIGQGQFLMRVDPNKFSNLYQVDVGLNNIGPKTTTLPNPSSFNTVAAQAGRTVQDATTDLTGATNLTSVLGDNFYEKYDYSSYEQLHQGQTETGPTYAVSTVLPSQESMTGGPTKENLQFTNSILMAEFLSGHYGATGYAYTPTQGIDTSRLFGPYVFRITTVGNESEGQLYQDAINSASSYPALYATDTALIAAGYVAPTARGAMLVNAGSSVGWNSNINNNTVVLSDNHTNFQKSNQGYQYWAQLTPSGGALLSGVVPGTYRMSIYQIGQWGETRIDNVVVKNNITTIPQNVKFTPENFSTTTPIWTIGTPDRSDHEFLNGSDASGNAVRQYQGDYDYWQEEANLGNPGKVVYYATSVPGHAATNDPTKWIANQWRTFNPGLYDPLNSTSDNYTNTAPQYVTDAGGPATYTGAPWEVHFTTTAAQKAQGRYITLSIGLAGAEASLTATLNGTSRVWHSHNTSDPMTRSGDAGFYQWIVFQWDNLNGNFLNANGVDNLLTLSVSATQGDMYDALRMEIGGSADPAVTGWNDYDFINSNGSTNALNADETAGLSVNQVFSVPEPGTLMLLTATLPLLLRRKRSRLPIFSGITAS